MNVTAAGIGAVADPRVSVEPDAIGSKEAPTFAHGGVTRLHDPNILFEEYHYWANKEREYEKTQPVTKTAATNLGNVLFGFVKGKKNREQQMAVRTGSVSAAGAGAGEPDFDEKKHHDTSAGAATSSITEEEWHTAGRAARTATWGAVFYLITTDILGPFSVPWAIGQLGYGPGFALYFVFGIFAAYSGTQLWQCFLGLDSAKYPLLNYGDVAYRIYGAWARHFANILQSLQFFLNVTLLIVGGGQSLVQLAAGPSGTGTFCFVAAMVVYMACGMIFGQVRRLQNLSYIANIAIWMNLFVIFMTMGITASSPPNWKAVLASYPDAVEGPIYHTASTPPGKDLVDQVNGLMQAVYSYGGATLFNELMAEMKRPWDFWKGLILADTVIFLCYIIFGMVVYSFQGQATYNPAYQGINPYSWQTVGNVFSLVTGLIAAILYGNIGIKVLYANVGREFLHFPPLESKSGKLIFMGFVPAYWACAFIIGAAVPQISYLGSFVGAAMILQFTYTFPPALQIGYNVLRDSVTDADVFDPTTGRVVRADKGFKRWARGYKVHFFKNTFDLIYFLGAVVTAILGIYASIVGMISSFGGGTNIHSFSCKSPTG